MPATRMAELGVIPKEAAKAVWAKGKWEIARIDEIERETKHDVIAFLTNLAEHVGPEARFVHQGMTSSDVLDTCLAVQMKQAADILLEGSRRAAGRAEEARARAQDDADHRPQPRHPCRADHLRPEARRPLRRLRPRQAAPGRRRATRSRPAPSPARSAPSPTSIRRSRRMSPHKLGLKVEPVSTQVIPRDRHAMFFATLGVIAVLDREPGDRDPPSAAHRGARGGGVFLAGPEGLLGHAAQAQPGADGEPDRPRAHRARRRRRRRWRTWRCGTSATSRTPRSSACSGPTPPSRSISRWRAWPA